MSGHVRHVERAKGELRGGTDGEARSLRFCSKGASPANRR